MATKRARQSTRKVKSLKVKSLSIDKAKHVKGGPINHPDLKRSPLTQS